MKERKRDRERKKERKKKEIHMITQNQGTRRSSRGLEKRKEEEKEQ